MDFSDLGFVDPSGGPFIQVGTSIEDRKINRIRFVGEKLFFEVE
jgi:hypothetical protein